MTFQHSQTPPTEILTALITGHLITTLGLLNRNITIRTVLAVRLLPTFRQRVLDDALNGSLSVLLLNGFSDGRISVDVLFVNLLPPVRFQAACLDTMVGHLA